MRCLGGYLLWAFIYVYAGSVKRNMLEINVSE